MTFDSAIIYYMRDNRSSFHIDTVIETVPQEYARSGKTKVAITYANRRVVMISFYYEDQTNEEILIDVKKHSFANAANILKNSISLFCD